MTGEHITLLPGEEPEDTMPVQRAKLTEIVFSQAELIEMGFVGAPVNLAPGSGTVERKVAVSPRMGELSETILNEGERTE
jgi:hypothetical protein